MSSARDSKPAGRAWQRMLSGRRLDLLDPSPADIEIEDIAHGLARVARWNGQTVGPHALSVAQHALVVEDIFSATRAATGVQEHANWQLAALLHDAPEYVAAAYGEAGRRGTVRPCHGGATRGWSSTGRPGCSGRTCSGGVTRGVTPPP